MYKDNQIKIGKFAKMIDENIKNLIYYDNIGYFQAFRTDTNRRYYTTDHIEKWKQMHRNR